MRVLHIYLPTPKQRWGLLVVLFYSTQNATCQRLFNWLNAHNHTTKLLEFKTRYLDSNPSLWTHHRSMPLVLSIFYEVYQGTLLAGLGVEYATVRGMQFEEPGASRPGE